MDSVMSDRDGPGRKPRVTDDEILDVIRESDKPVLPTSAIAEQLPIKHRGTLKRLNALRDAGRVESMDVGPRGQVWFVDDDEREHERDETDADSGREADESAALGSALHPSPPTDEPALSSRERAEAVVSAFAAGDIGEGEGWAADARLEDRKAAAIAVLAEALETGEPVQQSDAVDRFYDEHAVAGQNQETWWRKNGRAVLRAVGEHVPNAGYEVDPDRVDEIAGGEPYE